MSAVTAVPIRPLARGAVLKLWIALAVLTAAGAALAWTGTARYQEITLPSGVRYRVLTEGTGPAVTPADAVAMRYKLRVNDVAGEIIQDSDETGQPFVATTEAVYPGFGEGLQHMRAGGTYLLWLPPGRHEQGPIPPGAPFAAGDTLVFELQILQIAEGMASAFEMQRMQQLQQQMQMQQGPPPGADGPGGAPAGDSPAGGRGR